MTVDYRVGDSRTITAGIADGTVDLIASSPPFLALRSYLPAGHEAKGDEIGSESNPAAFIDTLLALTAEWGRVLAPHGSIAIELGDTYSGSGGAGGDYNEGGLRDGQGAWESQAKRTRTHNMAQGYSGGTKGHATKEPGTMPYNGGNGWPYAKSLALIPQLYAVALAYGINPLTGQPSPAGRWLVRNVIVWHRPNPAVGALGDKVRPSTSYIVVATRSAKRWFDLTAVRSGFLAPSNNEANLRRGGPTSGIKGPNLDRGDLGAGNFYSPHAGAPPLDAWFDEYDYHDTWTLTTQPSRISMPVVERVPCGPDDGGERTTSPDCPVHGDQADPAPTGRDGEPLDDLSSSRTQRSDDCRELGQPAVGADGASIRSDSGSLATPRDKGSSRTAPAPSTSAPGAPSAQTAADTARTPESPESSGDHPDTSASSSAEACPPVDGLGTAPRSDHTSYLESACTCTFHLEKHSIHSHYAMWPAKLAERLILMMCPREVCKACSEPRRRVERNLRDGYGGKYLVKGNPNRADNGSSAHPTANYETVCFTHCGHDVTDFRPGVVLDPFAGTGTTLAVADLHGRDAIGIDIDERNRDLYPRRYDEVKRALFGTQPEIPGQLEMAL